MLPERKEHGGALRAVQESEVNLERRDPSATYDSEDRHGPRAITGATCLSTRPVQDLGGDSEKGPEGERGVGGQRGGCRTDQEGEEGGPGLRLGRPPGLQRRPPVLRRASRTGLRGLRGAGTEGLVHGRPLGRVSGGRGAVWGACLSPSLLGSGPPSARTLPRPRKKRTVYLKEQLQALERHFWANRYPSYQERAALAAGLNLDEHQVQVWFKNRRAKHSRLPKGRGRGASAAAPGGRGVDVPQCVPAPPPVLVPARVPEHAPVGVPVPAGPAFPGGPGACHPAPHSPRRIPPAAEPGTCSLSAAPRARQGSVQAAPTPAPAPAPSPARLQGCSGSDIWPDAGCVLAPNFTSVVSPQDPLEGSPFPLMAQSQEGDDPAEDRDS
ncbi:NK1 transcription factor-related protein 2-like, partial [Leopardus geoffroyi]|uniref:NK1 transcription factor-related protein 2-like n=1 Tax=Leopardus geoffroyi TaxID=46844 RepID=UPI001E262324